MKEKRAKTLPILIIIFILFLSKKYIWIFIPLMILLLIELSEKFSSSYQLILNKLAKFFGLVNNYVLLSLVYILVIIPFSLFFKRFNKEKFNYFFDESLPSTFLNVDYKIEKDDFHKQW